MTLTPAALAFLLLLPGPRSYQEERQLLDRRLESLRRSLPDGPQPEADASHVAQIVRAAGIVGARVGARPPLETGGEGETKVEVAATAGFGDIERLFRQLALSPRLVDVQDLRLKAAGADGAVAFTAIVALPFRPAGAPLPRVPEGPRPSFQGIVRAESDAYLRDHALALDKTIRIATLRRSRRNPRMLLSEMSAALRGRPAQVTDASFGEQFFLRGLALGEGTMQALEARLERGFLRIEDVLQMRQGGCFRFEVRGRSPIAGPDADVPAIVSSPFGDGQELCAVDRDAGRHVVVRAPKRAPKAPRGPLSIHARNVDAADVFQLLASVGVGEFVVDADVAGRVDVHLPGVTAAQALDAVQQAGFRLEPATGLIRVRAGGEGGARGDLPPPPAGISEVRFAAKRARASDLLDAIAEVAPQAGSTGAPPATATVRLSLWTRSTPPAAVRTALAAVLGVDVAWSGAPAPATPTSEDRPTVLEAEELTVGEFDLVALAGAEGTWTAFAYGPDGRLRPYHAGDRLADAKVAGVESADVTLQMDDGFVRLLLP